MRIITLFSLAILTIAVILAAGCTGSSGTSGSSTAAPATTVYVSPVPVTSPVPGTPATTVTTFPPATPTATATPVPDPILHRWAREYPAFTSDMSWAAYEFIFLSDGSVVYNYGTPVKSGAGFRIVSQLKMSGTWQKIGDNTYRVSLPATSAGSQIYRIYTRVPASTDKNTGAIINEHIESSYETGSLPTGRDKLANEMYYPERADS